MRWSLALAFAAIPVQQLIFIPDVGPVTDVVVPLAVLGAAIGLLLGAPMRRPTATLGWLTALVVWVGASYFWSAGPDATAGRFLTYVQLLAFAAMALLVLRTLADRLLVVQGYVLGALVVVVQMVLNFLQGAQANASSLVLRFAVGSANPNRTAAALLIGMVCAWYLLVRTRRLRWVNLAVVVATPFALLLTASRSAFVAGASFGVLVLVWVVRTRWRGRAAAVALLVVGIGLALVFVPASTLERSTELSSSSTGAGSIELRAGALERGVEAFLRSPVAGGGSGSFVEMTRDASGVGIVAHNTYVSVAAELGAVGLALFLGAVVSAVRPLRFADDLDRWFGVLLLIVWGIVALFASFEDDKLTWLVIILLATTPEARAVAPDEVPAPSGSP